MVYDRTIQRIIDEEVSRILEADNSFQDSQFGGGGNFFSKVRDNSNGNPNQQQQAQQQHQQNQESAEGQQKQGLFGRMRSWASEKLGGMKNAVNQKLNQIGDKNFAPQGSGQQQGIIAELVKYGCLDQNTAVQLSKALFGDETDVTYITQAAQETQNGEEGQNQEGEANEGPSFSSPDDSGEGFSDEMVQNMSGKLSEDGSNPYANITVNLIDS